MKHIRPKLLAVWTIYLVFSHIFYIIHPGMAWDLHAYDKAADAIYGGNTIYTGTWDDLPYLYPPLLAILIMPLAILFSFKVQAILWFWINIGLILLALKLLMKNTTSLRLSYYLWAAPIFFSPVFLAIFLGQVSILLMILLISVWWLSFHNQRPFLAGFFLAVAIWIKLYPICFLPYFIWKKQWKVVVSTMITGLLLGGFQLAVVGWDNMQDYFTRILPNLAAEGQSPLIYDNNSIFGVASRLFSESDFSTPLAENPILYVLFRYGILIILLGSLSYLLIKKGHLNNHDLEYSLVMMLAPLLGSTFWLHGHVAWLMPITIILMHARTHAYRQILVWFCILAYVLISIHFPLRIIMGAFNWGQTPLVATLLLWSMIVYLLFNSVAYNAPSQVLNQSPL